jgi:inosine/xanthosine triphosphatase
MFTKGAMKIKLSTIALGSTNKAKISAVEQVVQSFEMKVIPISVPSGVSAQPLSDEETLEGARQRARLAREQADADFGIGLEGGVVITPHTLFLCNWGALTDGRIEVIAGGARIPLPEEFREPLMNGTELGVLIDQYAQKHDVRNREGTVGILTNGMLTRAQLFAHVTKLLIGQYLHQTQK